MSNLQNDLIYETILENQIEISKEFGIDPQTLLDEINSTKILQNFSKE